MPFEVLASLCGRARRWGDAGLAFATLLSVAFFSMARLSSLVPPSRGDFDATRYPLFADVTVTGTGATLRLKWAKCHQDAAQGFSVPLVPVQGSPACPLALLADLSQSLGGAAISTPLFAYGTMGGAGAGHRAFFTAHKARHWLSLLLRDAGLDGKAYTFHSLRRGACTRAYQQGAAIADLQLMGGWRGDSIDLYLPAEQARDRAAACLLAGLPSSTNNSLAH